MTRKGFIGTGSLFGVAAAMKLYGAVGVRRPLCFIDRVCTLDELLAAVRSNWKGPRGEERRQSRLLPGSSVVSTLVPWLSGEFSAERPRSFVTLW